MSNPSSRDVRPYGVAIHQAIAGGDLQQMRHVADAATRYLDEHGNVAAALAALKAEIEKLEGKS